MKSESVRTVAMTRWNTTIGSIPLKESRIDTNAVDVVILNWWTGNRKLQSVTYNMAKYWMIWEGM